MRIAGRRAQGLFSQVTYCGGYSGEVPPLPIPNREVKLTHADGTDPPVGRVGSRRSSEALSSARLAGLLFFVAAQLCVAAALVRCCALSMLSVPLRRFAGICSALPAPLRRFGRVPRSQKKFARDPLPPLYSAALVSVSVFPAPLRRSRIFPSESFPLCSAGICRALPAPLRRFGRVPRSQKKFARDPLPPLYSAALVSVSVFPASLRRSRIFPSEPFPLRSDASEQGSSLRQIRSEPCPSAFSAARLIFPFQLYFLRPGSSSFGAGVGRNDLAPARKKRISGRRWLA